jgi:hypothetical protein
MSFPLLAFESAALRFSRDHMSTNPAANSNRKSPFAPRIVQAAGALALAAGLFYLFRGNAGGAHWSQGYNPTG